MDTKENQIENKIDKIYSFKITEYSSHDLVVLECGKETCDANKTPINTTYYYYAFHIVIKGKGYYEIQNKKYELTENMVFCFFPGEKIKYYPDKSDPWEYYWINFSGLKAKDFITRCRFSVKDPTYSFGDETIISTIKKIVSTDDTYTRDLYTLSSLYEIIAKLIDDRYGLDYNNEIVTNNHVVNATNYITNNLNNPSISLKEVSRYLGISEVYLSKLFKKEVRIPFSKVINNYRIQAAFNYL